MEIVPAFYDIYTLYSKTVYNVCLNYLQNVEEAQDATQECFVKVHHKLTSFNHQSSLKTWIYRIAVNHCLDVIKTKGRVKRNGIGVPIFTQDGFIYEAPLTEKNHPGVLMENKQEVDLIFSAINKLPHKQKTVLLLKAKDDLSQKELAEILNVSEKALESILFRARKKLKEILQNTKDNQ